MRLSIVLIITVGLVAATGCKKNALEMCKSASDCEIECPAGTKVHTVTFDKLDHPDKALMEMAIGENLGEADIGSSFKYCARDDGKTPHGQFAGFDPSGKRVHFHQMDNGESKYGGMKELGKAMDQTGELIKVTNYAAQIEGATKEHEKVQGTIDGLMTSKDPAAAKAEATKAITEVKAEMEALEKVKVTIPELQPIHDLLVASIKIQVDALQAFTEGLDEATLAAKQADLQKALESFSGKEQEFEKAMEAYLESMGKDFENLAKEMEQFGAEMDELGKQLDKDLKAATGEINKGLEEAAKEMGKATGEINKGLEEAAKEMDKAAGELNKGLEEAAKEMDKAAKEMNEALEGQRGGAADAPKEEPPAEPER